MRVVHNIVTIYKNGMNTDILETIKDGELGFDISIP